MQTKLAALQNQNNWSLVPTSQNHLPIASKRVLHIKSDGSIEGYKVYLVTKRFNQQEGLNYHEIFALVSKLPNVRCPLAVVAIRK